MFKPRVRILVVHYGEDNPVMNTSLKMVRKGYAKIVNPRLIRGNPLVLNPFSNTTLGPWMRITVEKHGVLVVDASWRKLVVNRFEGIRGYHVKLPPLIAGNPVNYGKPCILSSIEAVYATLYLTGFREEAEALRKLYKWMDTFHQININLLEDYGKAGSQEELEKIINEYWQQPPC